MKVKKVTLVLEGKKGEREEHEVAQNGGSRNFLKFKLGRFDNDDPIVIAGGLYLSKEKC
ncbi:hypothetical protein ACFLXE_00045 [Chloroflexota bacterium]